MILLKLFAAFARVGVLTFGGGYAMIPMLEREIVDRHGWATSEELMDYYAVGQCTPGVIAVNTATFIGYKTAGVIGSAMSTLGVVLPSFIIIYIISLFLDKFLALTIVASAFKGIQACVVYLIGSVGIKMLKQMKKKPLEICIMSSVLICMIAFSLLAIKFSSIIYILIAGALGLIAFYSKKQGGKEESK